MPSRTMKLIWQHSYTQDSEAQDPALSHDSPKFRRTRNGCLTCRFRKKKCDDHRPVCKGCVRNQLLCSWSQENSSITTGVPRVFASSDESAQRSSPPAQRPGNKHRDSSDGGFAARIPMLDAFLTLESFPAIQRDPVGRTLLEHYVNSTASCLTVGTGLTPNPFLCLILPLAHHYDDILHMLLALSGSHLSFTDSSYTVVSRSHYAVALRAVRHRVTEASQGKPDAIFHLLIVLLLLCQFEVSSTRAAPMEGSFLLSKSIW
jgi:hypothetical protein